MKFVKKIGDGEVSIKDNQVTEKSSNDIAQDWVNSFTQDVSTALIYNNFDILNFPSPHRDIFSV